MRGDRIANVLPPPPPPLTRLEEMVLDSVPFDPDTPSLDVQVERFRAYLRVEVDRRLREVAKGEQVELPPPQVRPGHRA